MTIDGKPTEVERGATVLEAAQAAGIEIPTLCYLKGVSQSISCFVCAVEIEGNARLQPSCALPAAEGMVVRTDTETVRRARQTAIELLLSDHLGDCDAPCHQACPAALPIPEAVRLAASGQPAEAARVLRRASVLADALERVCPRLCEKACRRRARDAAVNIRGLFASLLEGHPGAAGEAEPNKPTGKRVAVVGAGPAGIAAAGDLAALGHSVELFDKNPEPGGLLRYGISKARLPRDVMQRMRESLEGRGVVFHGEKLLGEDVSLDALREGFDAVIVAIGAGIVESLEGKADGLGPEREPDRDLLRSAGLAEGEKPWANRGTLATGIPGVFGAGEAATGRGNAVRAAASGRLAAHSADAYLRGQEPAGRARPFGVFMGKLSEQERAAFFAKGADTPRADGDAGFSSDQAQSEARRCFQCDCAAKHDCRLRDLGGALGAKARRFDGERRLFARETTHPSVVYEAGKCIACQRCIDTTRVHMEKYGLTFLGRGFHVRTATPFNREMRAALSDATVECVRVCPTGALTFKRDGEPMK